MDQLVTSQWLEQKLGEPDIAIVDASAFLPTDGRDPAAEFIEAHIPGARFLDINLVADRSSSLPHMLPSAADFGTAMTELGRSGAALASGVQVPSVICTTNAGTLVASWGRRSVTLDS